MEMYRICVTVFAFGFVLSTSRTVHLSDGAACTCNHGLSSVLVCTLDTNMDFVDVKDDFCGDRIRAMELKLNHSPYLSFSMLPNVPLFRLTVSGYYLKEIMENAFINYEDSLQLLIIKESALNEIPSASLQGLPILKTLNLAGNTIHSLTCSLMAMPVENLILVDNQISNIYTCAFPMNLYTLNLRNNFIENLNGSLRQHHNLQRLYMERNKISSLVGELEGLTGLSWLDVSWNKIVTIEIYPLRFYGLRHLNLSRNSISKIGNILNGLLNLDTLDLSYNDLEAISTEMFVNLTSLTFLSVSSNRLRYLDDGVFEQLTRLEILDLSRNVIENLEGKLDNLLSLRKLDLSSNNIKIVEKTFKDLTRLEELDLSYNHIVDFGNSLGTLSRLKSLHLIFNDLKEVNEITFNGVENLETLDLSFNVIKIPNATVLASLTKLTTVILCENPAINLNALLIPGFMGIKTESTSLHTEGTPKESNENNCKCRPRKLTKSLQIGVNPRADLTPIIRKLEDNGIELIIC